MLSVIQMSRFQSLHVSRQLEPHVQVLLGPSQSCQMTGLQGSCRTLLSSQPFFMFMPKMPPTMLTKAKAPITAPTIRSCTARPQERAGTRPLIKRVRHASEPPGQGPGLA